MTGGAQRRLGADPSALDALAVELRAAADLLSAPGPWSWRASRQVAGSSAQGWSGPDAEAAVVLLEAAATARRRAAAVLDACAERVGRAALAQRRASLAGPVTQVRVDLPASGGRLVQRIGGASARTVVVLVPGIGTDPSDRDRLRRDAERLWLALADHTDDPMSVAVVSWLGYDPPDVVVQGVDTAPATQGAAGLAGEVRSLRTAGATTIAVVGHSYGGLVAGRAAADGMDADVVVQLGSPGVGAPGGTGAIGRQGIELVAVRAVGDPIGLVVGRAPGLFGEDPVGAVPGLPTSRTGHGGYLADPVLLDALAALVVGSPGAG
jgi:hypothetical protein